MIIEKVNIKNFKCYKDEFSLNLDAGINILVGNNEAGKSTILEAVHLALTGMLNGKYIRNELSQYLFNQASEKEYIESIASGAPIRPPCIIIEVFFKGDDCPELSTLEGYSNQKKSYASGLSLRIEFDQQYSSEYETMLTNHKIKSIPIEYYKVSWESFAKQAVTARSIPIKSSLIDCSSIRFQNGSDVYIGRIIRDNLEEKERVEISQAHREMKETFMRSSSIESINRKITENAKITNKQVKISVDLSTQNAWEMSLMTYLDDIPFHYIGKGEQSVVKTNLGSVAKVYCGRVGSFFRRDYAAS